MRGRAGRRITFKKVLLGSGFLVILAGVVATFALNKVSNYNFTGSSTGWTVVNTGAGIDGCGSTSSTNRTAFATFAYNANAFRAISGTGNATRYKGYIHQQVTIPGSGSTVVWGSFYYTGTSTSWRALNADGYIRLDLFDSANTNLVTNLACQELPGSNVAGTTVQGAPVAVTPGTYTIRATIAYRNNGTTTATITIDNIMVNPAPVGLAASAVPGSTNASLSWTNSTTVSGPNLRTGNPYQIYRGTASGGETALAFASSNSYLDSSTTGNSTYYYQVTDIDQGVDAVEGNADDNESPRSTEMSVLTCPGAPGGPTFSAVGANTITVNWTAPAGGSPNYSVERAPDVAGAPGAWVQVQTALGGTSWTDNTVACNTTYWYRVVGYNASGNGVYSGQASQATSACPVITTVGDGTNPADVPRLCPGGGAASIDGFSLQTNTGTDTVTAVQVDFSAGTVTGISLVEVLNDVGTVCGSAINPSDPQNIPLSTTIGTGTTLKNCSIRITPKAHADMPAAPGASYAATAVISDITVSNQKSLADSSSATVTIDNLSPSNAAWGTITPGDTQIALNWTNPGDADFTQVIILRNTATMSDAPVEGQTYSQGNNIGSSVVRYAGSGVSFLDTGLTNGQNYYYKIFAKDSCGNYSAGSEYGPVTPTTGGGGSTSTKAETASAAVTGCDTIAVRAPFVLDSNANSTTTVRRGAASTGPWTVVCNAISGASPRVCLDSGLAGGQTYYYQVTFTDPDGILGTNPQVIGPYTTPACVAGSTTITAVAATVSSCRQITVEAGFTGDSDNNGSVKVEWSPAGAGTWTVSCAAVKGPSPRRCLVTGLSPSGSYDIRVTYADPDGVSGSNPQVISSRNTPACGADQDPAMLMFLAPSKGAIIGGSEKVKVQVFDAGGLRALNPVEWQVDGGAWSAASVNAYYNCGASCNVYEFSLDTTVLANGPHDVSVRATDLGGNLSVETVSYTVNNRGSKAAGSGTLLRRTQGSQLCIDCHALETHSSQNTSSKYGNWAIDCLACHTPHMTTSLYLVRDTITTPSSGDKNIVFRVDDRSGGTNPQNSYIGAYDVSGSPYDDGVCEACHTKTDHYRNDASGGDHTHSQNTRCVGCHKHSEGFKGAGCDGCHRSPPATGKHSAHWQLAAIGGSYTSTTLLSTAAEYGYPCAKCHSGSHANDTHSGAISDPYRVEVAFDSLADPKNPSGVYSQKYPDAADQGIDTTKYWSWTSSVAGSDGNCATTYCHSNANPLDGTNLNQTPKWNQAASLSCNGCHNTVARSDSGVPTDLSNAHGRHIQSTSGETGTYAFKCDECHAQVIRDNPNNPWNLAAADMANKANHVTGTHNVNFNSTSSVNNINQSGGSYAGGSYTCTGTYCHSLGTATTAPFSTPNSNALAWNATSSCTSCHSGDASQANKIGTTNGSAKHANHVNNLTSGGGVLGVNYQCSDCHNTVVTGNTSLVAGAFGPSGLHVNGVKNVSMASGSYASPTCTSNYCHSSGQSTPAYINPSWTAAVWTNKCNGCHGTGNTLGTPDYANGGAGAWNANSHSKHVGTAADCASCHNDTTSNGTAVIAGSTIHTDGTRQVAIAAAWDNNGGTKYDNYNAGTKTCSSIKCHGAGSPQWGATNVYCINCHGGVSDSNNWNINDGNVSVINTTEWTNYGHGSAAAGFSGANTCLYCHDDTINHYVATNPFRLRGAANSSGVTGAYNALSAMNGNDICINCHDADAATRYGVDPDGASGGYALKKAASSFIDAWHYGSKHSGTDGGKRCWDCHDVHGDGTNIFMIGTDTLAASTDDYGLAGTRSGTGAVFTSGAAGGYTSVSATGICQVCHTQTSYWLANGTVQTHNPGTDCTLSCHQHQQPPNLAFKGSGTCMDCHKSRTGTSPNQRYIITGGAAGAEGDDFIRASRHVSNGTATSIVTDFDCILCHAEGKLSSTTGNIQTETANHGGDSGGTKTVDLRNVDSSGGTGIMVAWPGWRNPAVTPAPTITTADRDGMDSFCMGCHDANGASNVAVNAANSGLDTSTTGAAARRLTPFNTADTIRNSKESGAIATSRTRVIDVKSQFNSTNQVGKAWASHHNLNQFTKRYTQRRTDYWPDPAWTTYTTKEGQNIQVAGETAGLHCSDCHLNEVNAHGTRNTWYMLSDINGTDTAFNNVGYTTSTDICSKCHARTTYGMGNTDTTNSRTDAHNGAGARCNNIGWDNVPGFAYLGYDSVGQDNHLSCLGCHGGLAPGMIHGTNDTYEPWDTTPDGTGVSKRFRFMGTGGSMRWYSPNGAAFTTNTPTSDTNWEGTSTFGCYTISAADTYGTCTNHNTGRAGSTPNRARPLQY